MSDSETSGGFQREVLASVVTFLVALPLCVGIAVASGVPVLAGVLSGVIGGVVIGSLSGSPLLVSGPAAALAVMVLEVVQRLGLDALGPVVFLAGFFQLLCGRLGLGQWFRAVSPPVIHGLLGGIGILVMSSQLQVAVGRSPTGSGLGDLAAMPGLLWEGWSQGLGSPIGQALAVCGFTLAVIVGAKVLRSPIPATLVGVVAGTGAAHWAGFEIARLSLPENPLAEIQWLAWPGVARMAEFDVLVAGLALALVASAETLLCATALDLLHDGDDTEYDKELVAQGVGNLLGGLVGALPSVGLIVRSTASIEFGAKTRWPAILHGLWIGAAVMLAPGLLELAPVAALAGLLVYVGFLLAAKVPLAKMRSYGRSEVMIYGATLLSILGLGLLRGVALGVGLSLMKLLYTLVHLDVEMRNAPGRTDLDLRGAATFMQLPRLSKALGRVPEEREVHLHLNHLDYVDHACLELLSTWSERYERRGGDVIVEWEELSGLYHLRNRKVDGDLAEAA